MSKKNLNTPFAQKTYTVNPDLTDPNASSATSFSNPTNENEVITFSKINYIYLGISIFVIVLGYILLGMEKFQDVTEGFSIALHLAPFVLVLGYIGVIFAIFAKDRKA